MKPQLHQQPKITCFPRQIRTFSSTCAIIPRRIHAIATDNISSTTTERIFRELEQRQSASSSSPSAQGAGGGTSYADLQRIDAAWKDLRTREVYGLPPTFVRNTRDLLPATPKLDVIVAGGTLGIFLATALQLSGLNVAIVERGVLKGRSQEWNVSKKELLELVDLGVLTAEEAQACISIEFNPVRVGFHMDDSKRIPKDIWTRDVLNLGVSPEKLVAFARQRFQAAGGLVVERAALKSVWVHPNGVQVRMTDPNNMDNTIALAGKLLVDSMGNQSPIVWQVRHGEKPDGVCLVVGTCARGFDPSKNTTGDVIYTAAPSEPVTGRIRNTQLFWEAFPAGSGDPTDRTTYMFTYLDAHPDRPSLTDMLEHYWHAMPEYQGIKLEDVEIQRILFGLFPTYRDSPLPPAFNRILAVGDASGIQSPLSFGGFAALTRHLKRVKTGIVDAIESEALDMTSLKYINAYNPSLSGAWMMQRAMSIPAQSKSYNRDFINRLLGGNFDAMEALGEETLRPFLQDVIQPGPLARTLVAQMQRDPLFVPQIFMRVGVGPLADWLLHFMGMAGYAAAYKVAERLEIKKKMAGKLPKKQRYVLRRAVERWQYGSGLDYEG